ncbi:glycoside hydrolase family 99-like domain-containing protein [Litoricola sp.]|nr:glycoside hydrolase family 99-like domain-containing protein [Litorivicinus sp.]
MKKICFYLPQFHDDPLNHEVWGENFTDWVTSQNARPLYAGHNQPLIPAFPEYDLLKTDGIFERQVGQAVEVGLDSFSFYYYCFDIDRYALRGPLERFALSDRVSFPFCVTWANIPWTKSWIGKPNVVIAEQRSDNQFCEFVANDLGNFFCAKNYLVHQGKPVVGILDTRSIDIRWFRKQLELVAERLGYSGIYLFSLANEDYIFDPNIDLYIGWPPGDIGLKNCQSYALLKRIIRSLPSGTINRHLFKYSRVGSEEVFLDKQIVAAEKIRRSGCPQFSQSILTGWDNTPRYGYRGYRLEAASDEIYIEKTSEILRNNLNSEVPFTFVKAWNEWAEGNIMEGVRNSVDYWRRLKSVLKN